MRYLLSQTCGFYNIDNIIIGDDLKFLPHLEINKLFRFLTLSAYCNGAYGYLGCFCFYGDQDREGAIVGARSVVTKTVGEFDSYRQS